MPDEIRFHSERAMEELDRAFTAASAEAAKAHFDLSSLHLREMRALADPAPAPALRTH